MYIMDLVKLEGVVALTVLERQSWAMIVWLCYERVVTECTSVSVFNVRRNPGAAVDFNSNEPEGSF